MPIRVENKGKYPADWKAIRERILERAKDRCEWCGVANYSALKMKCCAEPAITDGDTKRCASCGKRVAKVVLTIAHLDHGLEDHSDANLAALCQRCHLGHDAKQHAAQAKLTRDAKRGQGRLVFE